MMNEYFDMKLESKNMTIKIKHADVIYYPIQPGFYQGIGFITCAKVKAGNLDGRMDIHATFKIPEQDTEMDDQSEFLKESINQLEFIKTTEELEYYDIGSTHIALKKV